MILDKLSWHYQNNGKLNRAYHFGWPNVYAFTKAMGEMLLEQHREDLPVVIIRPTMVTSTYQDPFPGWIEGARYIYYVQDLYLSLIFYQICAIMCGSRSTILHIYRR